MYDFLDLKLIRYISEEQTLTAAAERARMTTAAASQRLSRLENYLNEKLVFRSGGFGLTPAGRLLLVTADRIAEEIDNLEDKLRTDRATRMEQLRIVCSDSTLIDDLPFVLDELISDFPYLRLDITSDDTGLGQRLLDQSIDIAFTARPPRSPEIEATAYKSERACIIAPLTHALAQKGGPVEFEDALQYEFVGLNDDRPMKGFLDAISIQHARTPRYRIRVSSIEAQCILVGRTNLGIALTPEGPAIRHARTQPIQIKRISDAWATREHFICTAERNRLSDAGRHLIHLLEKHLTRR
ncbi:MAG: LysR family transcriptional regulator [Burkholderiaceae bacterium]|nr:LysR family transcriptional regulator [Burkholderiaceae bacterium]